MIVEALSSKPTLLVIEAATSILSLSLAFALPNLASRQFEIVESFLGRLAGRRGWMLVTIGLLACVLRLALLPIIPIPKPYVHDEFSYLLAADTFASGRLTNPTHPMWQHFESFHISHLPTYMSMYFPAQGIFLSAGKVLFGNPWFGVLLSSGVFCSVLYWMLAGWLPRKWAMFGGLLAVLRLALFSYWINAYHGGFVPAIGGTLVLGALPRLRRAWDVRNLLLMALGLAIVGNSRPFEGVLVAVPAVAMFFWWRVKDSKDNLFEWRTAALRLAAPCALLVLTLAGMAYYNDRVFGNWSTIPYKINRDAYAPAPHFIWQTPRIVPVHRHEVMRAFYVEEELAEFNQTRTLSGFAERTLEKVGIAGFFVVGFALALPLLMMPTLFGDRRIRYLMIAGAIFAVGLCVNPWLFPHYVAPFLGGMYVILLQCMRHLRASKPSWGVAWVRYTVVACLLLAGLRAFSGPLAIAVERWPSSWYGSEPLGLPRAAVLAQLQSYPGKQLVLVRYSAEHTGHKLSDDWVYNAADIDHSQVVWAREMDARSNAELMHYFSDREAWLVSPDSTNPGPIPLVNAETHLLSHSGLAQSGLSKNAAQRQ